VPVKSLGSLIRRILFERLRAKAESKAYLEGSVAESKAVKLPCRVFLVGAGPGDPGLITVRGRECIARADVIIYDHLANPAMLDWAETGSELIYVGKKGGKHTMAQGDINALIVSKSREGKVIVRLKGGDPFIFGRGGEEAEVLAGEGIAFEVVPGITSAIAVPAYAGIPLTHRDYTSTVAFVTGHEDPCKSRSSIDWDRLATGVGTLVFLMGVGNLGKIASRLTDGGRSPETPVAMIRQGTTPSQCTIVGTLSNISNLAEEQRMKPPAVIVVGEVVSMRDTLGWFEKRPLFGRRIIVTRARAQASGFLSMLEELGAECIEFPTIEVVPPDSWSLVDDAIHSLETFDWLLFTSANGAEFFLARLAHAGKDIRDLKGIQIAAIGPKTAAVLGRFGIQPDLVPGEYRAEATAAALKERGISGARILLARAAKARDVLPVELRAAGCEVLVAPVYKTIRAQQETSRVRKLLVDGEIDAVTFTSSSTVTNFIGMFEGEETELSDWMKRTAVACIGPVTAETARGKGLEVAFTADPYTIESLCTGLVSYFTEGAERRAIM
jgi:uroporphyrinogen III methyltransferase/synthase